MVQRVEVPGAGVLEFPDGMTDAQMAAAIQKNFPQIHEKPQEAGPTLRQKVQASAPMRVVQGMRDPIDAGAQLLPRGLSVLASGAGMFPNRVSEWLDKEAKSVDQGVKQNEQEYNAARKATGSEGFDVARLTGNVLSPANAGAAALVGVPAKGAGVLANAGRGFVGGATGGALTPVVDSENFGGTKFYQTLGGGAAGAVFAPIANKAVEAATPLVKALVNRATPTPMLTARAKTQVGEALTDVERDIGSPMVSAIGESKGIAIAPGLQAKLEKEALEALKSGKKLDVQAALRKADFDALGMQPTLGQVTRDATQFAREKNIRGVQGVGEPVQQRFDAQNVALQQGMRPIAAGAKSEFQAGDELISALRKVDESMRGTVSAAYKNARNDAGKDLELPLQGLAQDYAAVVDNFADKIPNGVRNQFKALGLESGTKQKIFTPEEADRIIKVINDHVGSDKATNTALDALRGAVKKSVLDAPATDVFEPARKVAAARFKMHDAIPALEAAVQGKIAPDDFVNRYLINGKTKEVQALASALSESPEAKQQARAQIGSYLQRAAFGENVAGDKLFTPERFSKALRDLGDEKLGAFFTPAEVGKLKTVMRVGSYINSTPTSSPVSTSNSQALLASMLLKIPGIGDLGRAGIAVGGAAKRAVQNANAVETALQAKAPPAAADISPETARRLAQLLGASVPAVGGLAAIR
jgi:hypothetical protein